MPNTYTLKITGLEVCPIDGPLNNVILKINWSHEASDETFSTAMSGSTNVPAPDPASFIPFADLTETVVLSWVRKHTPEALLSDYERQMGDWIAAQHVPPVILLSIPWGTK